MDSDSSDERYHDDSNAAGGGASSFNMFSSTSSTRALPDQPGAYEDFEFPSPFDFDGLFSSSALAGPSGPSGNPFSPSSFSPAYQPSHSPAPPRVDSPNPFPFASSSSNAAPAVPPAAPEPNTGGSLFDPSETALFSSFLNTLDVDPNFLFNPVLPPGMPSPPPAVMPKEESTERERLGTEVGGLSLGAPASRGEVGGWSQSTREVDVKPIIPPEVQEPQPLEPFEDEPSDEEEAEDDTEGDPDFQEGSKAPLGRGRRTRASAQQAASGRGSKKARVQKEEEGEETVGEDGDVEMAETGEETTTSMGPPSTTTRRRTSRAPAARRGSTSAASRPVVKPRASTSTLQRSPSFDPAASPPIDRKAPLTETQKRSNHIQSEQKRRNAIRNGFKDLVDILSAGELASGIVVAPPEADDDGTGAGKKKKGKGTGRGRGRKGEVGAGASKSVVLNKAAEYILWLERGNEGLEQEVERVELALREAGLEA
ncbi:hypothetical protein BCR35DRAFT_310525 [Leucosporidium creatinivorum]|uniref:BHLH domain-containing protein n=1 Tax=Leucosporidium creatinivorum TaxID=106004 RepID=A0A1Y2D2B0_9BASI|nr:hypothetical protein BCR35DRAFT_310525 [Leucosporidium creatinivorum]